MDPVNRAQEFLLKAHERIEQQRKHSNLPCSAHLTIVARSGSSVTDNPDTIASKPRLAVARPRFPETISTTLLVH